MTKTIAITGATGAQGGGVANVLLRTPGWKVRAITRNTTSEKAKDLVARGAEVVQADLDNVESLIKAFEGAHAIFAVTNFWEHVVGGKGLHEAGRIEEEQGIKLAHAAVQTKTLEHYLWSTLPSANKLSDGKVSAPHLDYKANVDNYIKTELPELAKKTTYIIFGFYSTNLAFTPVVKPFEMPGSYGKYIQLLPTRGDAIVPLTGDMTTNPGIWARQILTLPEKSKEKYVHIATEFLTYDEMLNIWSDVTGRTGVHVNCSLEEFIKIWGTFGEELGAQFKLCELITDWNSLPDVISKTELDITDEEVLGHRKALEALREHL